MPKLLIPLYIGSNVYKLWTLNTGLIKFDDQLAVINFEFILFFYQRIYYLLFSLTCNRGMQLLKFIVYHFV